MYINNQQLVAKTNKQINYNEYTIFFLFFLRQAFNREQVEQIRMVTAVFMLCGEHTPLSSPWKVRLQSHPPACIFPAAHTDCFADTTMSKGPGFHLYIPLIYFKFLKKYPALFFIYSSSAVLKLANVRTQTYIE